MHSLAHSRAIFLQKRFKLLQHLPLSDINFIVDQPLIRKQFHFVNFQISGKNARPQIQDIVTVFENVGFF